MLDYVTIIWGSLVSSCGNLTYAKRSYGYGELKGIAALKYETKGGRFGLCEKFLFSFFMWLMKDVRFMN